MGLMEAGRTRIAVVDDDPAIREVVGDMLASGGMDAVRFACASDFLSQLSTENSFDLIILDLQLPDLDGFSVAANIRTSSSVPIIMLTGRDEELDRVMGLEIGADDYLAKPFSTLELIARVQAVLRRTERETSSPSNETGKIYRFNTWRLDPDRRELIASDNVIVPLSTGEFELLHVFVQRPNRVLSREQLLDLARGRDTVAFDRSIDTQVSRLRRKIEQDPKSPIIIKTVWGGGYVLSAEVTRE
mgnify:CR=1 FL=1